MNTAHTAKTLSSRAPQILALAGLVASPASAATHTTERAGFVPKRLDAVVTSTCYDHTCIGVKHSGTWVYSMSEHFFNWPGVHIGHFYYEGEDVPSAGYYGSHQGFAIRFDSHSPLDITTGTICGNFNTVPPAPSAVCVKFS
jgi:hypothetical protein